MPKPFKLATAVVAVLSVAAAARGDILITNGPLTVDADSSRGAIPLGRGAYSSGTHSLLHGSATSNLQEPSVLWQVLETLKPGQGVSTVRAINGRVSVRGAWVAYATAVTDRRPLVMGSLDSPAVGAAGAAPPDIAVAAGRFPALARPAHGLWKFVVTGTGDGPDATDSDADLGDDFILGAFGGSGPLGGDPGFGATVPRARSRVEISVMPLPPAVWMGLAGIAGVIALRRRRIV